MEVSGGQVDQVLHAEGHPHGIKAEQPHATEDVHHVLAQSGGALVQPVRCRLAVLQMGKVLGLA